MKKKIRVVLVFGGKSAEHEVSFLSAKSIFDAFNKEKFDVSVIGITKLGQWISGKTALEALTAGQPKLLSASTTASFFPEESSLEDHTVFFPVIHGTYGEDGSIQGMFEMMGAPYVGCGVLASALGMDKIKQKELFEFKDIPIVPFYGFSNGQWENQKGKILSEIFTHFSNAFPLFVKPANTGSSIGITKVKKEDDLKSAIETAFLYDTRVIVEKGIERIKEVEVSVLGNDMPKVSICGEITYTHEFYDYDAKYKDETTAMVIPAKIDNHTQKKIQDIAKKAFLALDCSGLARIDFFVTQTGDVFLNEVNTIPGFTKYSMYPKLWEASGISFSVLLEKLVNLSLERFSKRTQRKV